MSRLDKSEDPSLVSLFSVGDVLAWSDKAQPFLLLERRYASWPTWESLGRFWQWRVVRLDTGKEEWLLENAMTTAYRFPKRDLKTVRLRRAR